jgi:site-specific recombinase XerC
MIRWSPIRCFRKRSSHCWDYGTHFLRRTKASIIYKQTGNLRAVQILLGHTKIESTVRYLGVDIEDALALAEGTEV